MNLTDVHFGVSKHKRRKRIGRGPGSGWGKTAARGEKGQRSRAGHSISLAFQGGAMPMVRRVPKRGFNNRGALVVKTINVSDLENAFEAGAEVTPATLKEHSLAKGRYDELKVLGDGALTKAFRVSAHRFSKTAIEKIEKAGGTVMTLPGKTPPAEKGAGGRPKPKRAVNAPAAAAKTEPEEAPAVEDSPTDGA